MGVYLTSKVAEILQDTKGVYVKDKSDSSWTFTYKGAQLSVRVLPGCCGILLVYRISGKEKESFRLIKAVAQSARKAQFGMVMLSLLSGSALRKLLTAPDWNTTGFKNPRTRNDVEVLTYVLPVKIKPKRPSKYHEDN